MRAVKTLENSALLPQSVRVAFEILRRDYPLATSNRPRQGTRYPDSRACRPVVHGFFDYRQIRAMTPSQHLDDDWPQITWLIFNSLPIAHKHLKNIQFIALLEKSGVLAAICESGVFGTAGVERLVTIGKKSSGELTAFVSELTQEQLRAAFFVYFYFTICYSDSVIWLAIANERDFKSGFLTPTIVELERRIDNLALCLSNSTRIQVEDAAITLLCRLINHINSQFERPVLVMPALTIFMASRDDALNPAHALYASAGAAFLKYLDSRIIELLLQPDLTIVVTALQYVYMCEFLVDEKTSRKMLEIPFSQFSFDNGVLISNNADKREIWLTDRSSLIWSTLCKSAYEQWCALFNAGKNKVLFNVFSASSLLDCDIADSIRTQRRFKQRSRQLFRFLNLPDCYVDDLLTHPSRCFGGVMQTKLSGLMMNHLRNPWQTHSLPRGEPGCWEVVPLGRGKGRDIGLTAPQSKAEDQFDRDRVDSDSNNACAHKCGVSSNQNFSHGNCNDQAEPDRSGTENAGNDGQFGESCEFVAAVDVVLNYRDWLASSTGIGLKVAHCYENSLRASSPLAGVETLAAQIASIRSDDPAWSCALAFIHSKVESLVHKLQAKSLKKIGELKPLFEYFLPCFDLCCTQIDWAQASSSFETMCVFYKRMLALRGEQHSVREILGLLIIDFHNNHFIQSKGTSEVAGLILDREDLDLEPAKDTKIRVHYASPLSYRVVLDQINRQYAHLNPTERDTMSLLHILLYRLTLRRGEILSLRLGDFHWAGFNENDAAAGHCQLIVRGDHLKSTSAHRMITLNGLLKPDELSLVHRRCTQLRQLNDWCIGFFIVDPLDDLLANQLEDLHSVHVAGQTQLDRLIGLWRKLPAMHSFTVHSYRHCAVNNAFVHLVLGSLDEQRRATSRLPWMRDPEFSNDRNLSVTQSITAVPVNSGARPLEIAFELIRFCGHLHFRTTRHTYLHLMNWACMVALNQVHEISVSKAGWGCVLGLRDRANLSQRKKLMHEYSMSGDLDPGAPSLRLLVVRVVRALQKSGALA